MGGSLGSSIGPGTVLGFQEERKTYSSQSLIWTICLNSILLANVSLHHILLLSATLHGSHSTWQLCFHRQIQAREWPGPLQRRPSFTLAYANRASGPPTPDLQAVSFSFSILWQILASTDARAAKCIVLNKNDLPACPLPSFLFQDSYTSRGLMTGEWEGRMAGIHEQI